MRGHGQIAFRFLVPTLLFLICAPFVACGGDTSKSTMPVTSGSGGGTAGSGAAGSGSGAAGSGGSGSSASGTAGTGAAGTSGGVGTAGVTGTSGTSGSAGTTGSAGTGGSTGGGGALGTAGTSGGAGTTGAAGAGGGSKPAVATMVQANGNGVEGKATFTPDAMGFITLVLTAKNCPGNGAHAFHIGVMADCGNDGINAGMHWSPKGDMLGMITCNGGTGGTAMYKTPSAGYWTIGTGDATSDILKHAVVIDSGSAAMPGMPIACGVPRND